MSRLLNGIIPMNGKTWRLVALLREAAPPAFADYWGLMHGLVGQLAARQAQVPPLRIYG